MSAIAYYLEDEGIATTGISLVRENTESFAPPRFLWVSFPLGRPLGRPGDPDLQHRVIARALSLLGRDRGPVLEDFEEDVPESGATAFVCPVSFAAADDAQPDGWESRLRREIANLAPWYEACVQRRGRTSVGILAESPRELGARLGALLDEDASNPPQDIRYLLEDLKAYYLEAVSAQPGAGASDREQWLWHETALGLGIVKLRANLMRSDDKEIRELGSVLAPRWVTQAPIG